MKNSVFEDMRIRMLLYFYFSGPFQEKQSTTDDTETQLSGMPEEYEI